MRKILQSEGQLRSCLGNLDDLQELLDTFKEPNETEKFREIN